MTMELHDDDKPVGRVLTRREMLALLGGTGAAFLAATGFSKLNIVQQAGTAEATAEATTLPSCVVKPAKTEGPYFVDEMLNRSDIRVTEDGSLKEGTKLRLVYRVMDVSANACTPIQGAQVDVWHCDALGVYSDVTDRSFSTVGEAWLRGYQLTDEYGMAEFITIYPGWYPGRTVHIHFKIRTDPASETGYEFTSQLFFPETLSDAVYQNPPYNQKGQRNTTNATDGIYGDNGDQLLLSPTEEDDGYYALFDIGLDLSESAPTDNFGGGPNGGQGGRPGGPPPNGGRPGTQATATPASV
jgi:protocatechuate 3,4-dioxygenase beta subunit